MPQDDIVETGGFPTVDFCQSLSVGEILNFIAAVADYRTGRVTPDGCYTVVASGIDGSLTTKLLRDERTGILVGLRFVKVFTDSEPNYGENEARAFVYTQLEDGLYVRYESPFSGIGRPPLKRTWDDILKEYSGQS